MNDADDTTAANALSLLDARGRQAAASLTSAVDALLADAPPVPLDTVVVDSTVVGRDDARRHRSRRALLVAAAVVTAAGITAGMLLSRAGDEEGLKADATPTYLVPRTVPDGWEVQEARVVRKSDFSPGMDVTITAYGDAGRDDPWSGPLVTVYDAGAVLAHDGTSDGEAIVVGGRPATIDESGGTVTVEMDVDDRTVMVSGAGGVDRSQVIAAAEALRAGDLTAGLPEGLEKLAEAPGSIAVPFGTFAYDGLALIYGGGSSADGVLAVVQQAGEADDVELVAASTDDVEEIEVHGRPAYLAGGTTLQWYEPGTGLVVTVLGDPGMTDAMLELAESMEPGRPNEIDDLVKAYGISGPFDRLQPGEVVVAESGAGERPWQLVASDDAGSWGLSFEDASGSTGMGVDATEGAWGTLDVGTSDHGERAVGEPVGVFGAVTAEAAEVVIEAPGHEPVHLELHTVVGIDGWDAKVFAGLIPADMSEAEVVAVAVSADGTELDRMPISAGGSASAGASMERTSAESGSAG